MLQNKLGITSSAELNREEERLSKLRAKELYSKNLLVKYPVGSFEQLQFIHYYLFQDIYEFAGKIRDVNIAKHQFRFAPVIYLYNAILEIERMDMDTFDTIIEKYVEMNIAHPFREGNGRSMRIWLDQMLKYNIKKVIDWTKVDKIDYLNAMERSPINDLEIKLVLKNALTEDINDREIFMKGIDISYYYEGYDLYDINELGD